MIEESDKGSVQEFWDSCLNYRSKLTNQVFSPDSWLVVYGAGGGIPAAAHTEVGAFGIEPPVIDQTLYWIITDNEEEAIFLVGLINSDALLERIADYIPRGAFGDRHLHTLPSVAVPQYDAADEGHARVVATTRALIAELQNRNANQDHSELFTTEILMSARRRRLRAFISEQASFAEYSAACIDLYEAIGPVPRANVNGHVSGASRQPPPA